MKSNALIRAVVEGIALNKRLLIDAEEKKLSVSGVIRFAGGGALSDSLCRILADATGSYRAGFTLIALLAGLGSVFFLMAKKPALPERA